MPRKLARKAYTYWGAEIGLGMTPGQMRAALKKAGFERISESEWQKKLMKFQKIGGVVFYPKMRWGVEIYLDGQRVRKEQFGFALQKVLLQHLGTTIESALKNTIQRLQEMQPDLRENIFPVSKKNKPKSKHLINMPLVLDIKSEGGDLRVRMEPASLTVKVSEDWGKTAKMSAGEMFIQIKGWLDDTNFPYFDFADKGAGLYGPEHRPAKGMAIVKKKQAKQLKGNWKGIERRLYDRKFRYSPAIRKAVKKWMKESEAVRTRLQSFVAKKGEIAAPQDLRIRYSMKLDPNYVKRLKPDDKRISPEKNIWLGYVGHNIRKRYGKVMAARFLSVFDDELRHGEKRYPFSIYRRAVKGGLPLSEEHKEE